MVYGPSEVVKSGEKFDLLIVDETHLSAAGSYKRIIDHFTLAILLGLTATTERQRAYRVRNEQQIKTSFSLNLFGFLVYNCW